MSFTVGHYILDRAKLPAEADDVRARFVAQRVNTKSGMLVLYPLSEQGADASYVRFAGDIEFRHVEMRDQTLIRARGLGQLVVTRQRILGVITDGALGETVLDEDAGSVYAFSVDLDDCRPPQSTTNWRGKPTETVIASKPGPNPPFGLKVSSIDLVIANDGQVRRSAIPDLIQQLAPGGQWTHS